MDIAELLDLNAIDNASLTAFGRMVPDPANYTLKQWLPDIEIQGIKYKTQTTIGTQNAAKFRAYDTETPLGRRAVSRTMVVGELPPLGQKTTVGELETILNAIARGADNADLLDTLYDDVTNNVAAIRARMELARGDLLTDGVFTLDGENGLTLEADFGLASDHKPDRSGSTTDWLTAPDTATPLTDELGWIQQIADDGGSAPEAALSPLRLVSALAKNPEYRNAYYARDATGTPTLTPAQLQAVRDQWNLPPITTYDAKVSVDGVLKRPIPDSQFILLNRSTIGNTQWGTTAESLVLSSGSNPSIARQDAPGIIVTRRVEDDPVRVWVRATANAMPTMQDTLSYISAKVTAPSA